MVFIATDHMSFQRTIMTFQKTIVQKDDFCKEVINTLMVVTMLKGNLKRPFVENYDRQ